ncbi:ribosomal-protein-alanine acetyltransferase [[Clostridium] sordellii]|uniref:GNAT family N-acetyltransferase n=1 Tax=Paraclostridium sordellii TaxID=1505 RepID=UPI0005DDFD1C|nr:GNAT family N-acetyltransferase [Paeniclostridium sordellii]CEQ21302.1 ribosomal-protein-alanine acetyltransferase [[Clostridium] sordellii] [Paeniclostridium sordellii]
MDNIVVKFATNEDIDKIIEFEKEARLTEPGVLYWSINDKEYKNKLIQLNLESLENSKIVIVKQGDKVIGRCDICIMLSLVNCEKVGYVDWIYTLKNFRGRGIGKILLEKSENYFKSRFVSYYFLMTASNEQAQEFYHRQDSLKFSKREVAEKDF